MVLAAVLLQLLYLRVYAARVAFFSHPTGDSAIYLELAGRVATGAGPSGSYRAPAYQYLLALPLKLGQGRLAWVYLCQVLMNAGTLVLVYLLGRRLAGRVAGTAALVLAGLSAPLWFYASKVVSATPVVLLVALGALLVLSGRWWRWPAAGLAFGAAALCWPGSILVALGVAGMGLLLGQASWRRVGLLAAGGLLAVAPVTVRNAAAMRDFVPISANGGFTFYQGNNRLALGTLAQPPEMYEPGPDGTVRTGVGEQEAFDSGYAATALNRPVRRSAASWFWTGRALAWMRRHPADYLRLLGRKLVLAFSDYDSATEYDLAMERELVWPLRLGFVGFGLLLALAAAGLVLAGSRRLWPAYGVVAGTLLALLVFYVNGRYRLAMVPALAVLGGNGVAAFAGRVRAGRVSRRPVAALVLAASVFLLSAVAFVVPLRRGSELLKANAYRNLGEVAETGDLAAAARMLGRSVELQRRHAAPASRQEMLALREAWLRLGSIYGAQGQPDSARQVFAQALRQFPDDPVLLYNLSVAALKSGDSRTALAAAEGVLRLVPGHPLAERAATEARRRMGSEGRTIDGGAGGAGGTRGEARPRPGR